MRTQRDERSGSARAPRFCLELLPALALEKVFHALTREQAAVACCV
jgi:hypothetical protein